MRCVRNAISYLAVLLLLGGLATSAWGLDATERVKLQAAMQIHVDKLTVDGRFIYFDETTGEVRALYPITAHPKILTGDGYQVLCFDFRDDRGNDVNVDFFMAPKDDGYIIFHTAVDNDRTLARLSEAGRLTGTY